MQERSNSYPETITESSLVSEGHTFICRDINVLNLSVTTESCFVRFSGHLWKKMNDQDRTVVFDELLGLLILCVKALALPDSKDILRRIDRSELPEHVRAVMRLFCNSVLKACSLPVLILRNPLVNQENGLCSANFGAAILAPLNTIRAFIELFLCEFAPLSISFSM